MKYVNLYLAWLLVSMPDHEMWNLMASLCFGKGLTNDMSAFVDMQMINPRPILQLKDSAIVDGVIPYYWVPAFTW